MTLHDDPGERGAPHPSSRPPEGKRTSTSWWLTLPGVLTGLAATITAVTGLIIALRPFASDTTEVGSAASGDATPSGLATLSGAADPTTGASTTGGSAASGRPLVLPAVSAVQLEGGDLTIGVLSAALEPYSAAKELLRLKLRFTCNGDRLARTYYTDVRVVIDEVLYAPEDPPWEQIEGHSMREFDYVFQIPAATGQAVLRFIHDEESRDLPPLDLRSPA